MNRTQLIDEMANQLGGTKKDAERALDSFVDVVSRALEARDKVSINGFAILETSERPEREARNPRTKETVKVAATTVVKFKPSQALKDKVANGGAPEAKAGKSKADAKK